MPFQNLKYWLISAPESGKEKVLESLQNRVCKVENLAQVWKFPVPDLRAGTLDALMTLSDDLAKIDTYVETITRKIAIQLFALLDADPHSSQGQGALRVNTATPEVALTHFKWDEARYPVKSSCREITETINSYIAKLDEELRSKSSDYSTLSHSMAAEQRKISGNLLSRDLTDVVTKDHVIDSEYLTTLFVVVSKYYIKEWEQSYETLTDYVLPRSSQQIFEDQDYVLCTVVLFRKVVDDFKVKAKEKRFTVRDFKFSADQQGGNLQRKKISDEKDQAKGRLIQWCRTNFQEAFIGWLHIKAIRVFVESILRYGLCKFQALLVLGHKKEDKKTSKSTV